MSAAKPIGPVKGMPPRDERAELRKLSQQLEGVFVGQLFKAMRSSVSSSGLLPQSQEEEMFTSLLDDAVAAKAAERMKRGMAEALYRQLSRRLDHDGTEPAR
jgi:flagellar protein FlgJ